MSLKRSVVRTGKLPGVTRQVSGFMVSENPPIWMVDSPGIMLPRFQEGDAGLEVGLKLALTGAIKDKVVGHKVLSRYLLYTLNRMGQDSYCKYFDCTPSEDVEEVLAAISRKVSHLGPANDREKRAAQFFVEKYRDGMLGKLTLDDGF